MAELAPERKIVKAELKKLHVDAWVFETDAGARAQSIQQTYLKEVEAADFYGVSPGRMRSTFQSPLPMRAGR